MSQIRERALYFFYLLSVTILFSFLLIHWSENRRLQQLFPKDFFVSDPKAGPLRKPHQVILNSFSEHPLGIIRKQTNNLGFLRSDSTAESKTPGTRRILVTGDSHTDGVVSLEENFCTLLQDSLTAAGVKAEVLNAGTGYYSFRHYAGILKKFAYLRPDEFVVMIYTGNDFIENLFYDYHWTNPFQSFRQFRGRLGWRYQYPLMYQNQSLTQVLYFHLYPQQRQQTLRISQDALNEMQQICRQQNIRLRLFLLPSYFDLNPAAQQRIKEAYPFPDSSLLVNRFFSRQIALYARRQMIEVEDLAPMLQSGFDSIFYPKDQHLNPAGNRLVYRALLPYFLP